MSRTCHAGSAWCQVDHSPAGFHKDALEERVNHAHAVGALQDGLNDAGSQGAAVPLLKLVPAQITSVRRWAGICRI